MDERIMPFDGSGESDFLSVINAEVDKSSLRFKGLLNYAKRIKKVSSLHYTNADS